jgi:hypothetical protein
MLKGRHHERVLQTALSEAQKYDDAGADHARPDRLSHLNIRMPRL